MADTFRIGAEHKREIAGAGPDRDITRRFTQDLAPRDDAVLASQGGRPEIYEEVLRDDQVFSALQQRRLALVSREWEVVPGAEDAASRKAADFARELLGRIGFDKISALMHYGVFYGVGIAEILWAQDGGNWTFEAVKVRRARRFAFGADGRPRLLTKAAPVLGEALPERKFWTFSTGADNDDAPYGKGLAHWLYWPVWFKRNGIRFWAVYLDRFGAPTPVGRYGPGATAEDQKKLLEAVAAIQTDSGVILPEGMMIELLEATRGGTADFTAFHGRQDAAIAKVILSQTMTTDDGSSLAQANVHAGVKAEVVKADADLICGSFNDGPLRWLTEVNFAGAAPPKVWRSMEEPEDLNLLADRDLKLYQMGFAPTPEYVQRVYGDGYAARAAVPAAPEFAEKGGDEIDGLAAQLDEAAMGAMDRVIGEIARVFERSESLEDAGQRLLALRPELKAGEIADVLRQALSIADLSGRNEILGAG